MLLKDFRPISRAVVAETLIDKPRFPVIDAHNHLAMPFGGGWDERGVDAILGQMEAAGVVKYVDLDGGWGEDVFYRHLKLLKTDHADRFAVFGGVDWDRWAEEGDGFGEAAARRFEAQIAAGADGLKIWKPFGLTVRDQRGSLVAVNDPRLDPLWQTAGEHDMPVMIHVADPVAFFTPVDERNERWMELGDHPDWAFFGPQFPSFEAIMTGFEKLIARHPGTRFVGAHVGCYSENLGWVDRMLDTYPNFFIDFSARINELGRKPYSSAALLEKHADRVLFGLDHGPEPAAYRLYYRFLETRDENFSPATDPEWPVPWRICGLGLSDTALKKIYYDNAETLIFSRPGR